MILPSLFKIGKLPLEADLVLIKKGKDSIDHPFMKLISFIGTGNYLVHIGKGSSLGFGKYSMMGESDVP